MQGLLKKKRGELLGTISIALLCTMQGLHFFYRVKTLTLYSVISKLWQCNGICFFLWQEVARQLGMCALMVMGVIVLLILSQVFILSG